VDGAVVQKRDTSGLGLEDITAVTNDFEGRIQQLPPPFSAVKHKGRPMYQYARAGVDIEQRPRTVNVEYVEVTSLSDADNQVRLGIKIICGPGTYVRSLVHDIGERLGCGACVAELRRLRSGIFSIKQAVSLHKLVSAEIDITKSILSVEKATEGMPSVQVGEEGAIAVGQGKPLQLEWVSDVLSEDPGIPRCTFRVLDSAGMLLAIYGPRRAEDGQEIAARPIRVLRPLILETGENEAAQAY
jgi:tRNA pseudouridine55 synthase